MLRVWGAENVDIGTRLVALPPNHPYLRLPVQFATSLRGRILDGAIVGAAELDALTPSTNGPPRDPATGRLSFVVTQVWARKPG